VVGSLVVFFVLRGYILKVHVLVSSKHRLCQIWNTCIMPCSIYWSITHLDKLLIFFLKQMEMYYVREYTATCWFLKIINSILTGLTDYLKKSTVGVYSLLHSYLSCSDWVNYWHQHTSFWFSFIFRWFMVFQVSQMFTYGLSDL
jgi:hypothetical protein